MNEICIGLAGDDRYAPYLGVVLFSLLKNNPQEFFDIFIIDVGISVENKTMIDSLLKDFPQNHLNWVNCDPVLFDGLRVDGYISSAVYARVFLAQFIPMSYDKCLYLDSDVLVLGKIRSLWETNVKDVALAAVEDPGIHGRAQALNIPSPDKYFNSGVLLMNLTRWRQEDISSRVIDFIRQNSSTVKGWDQDGLNAILYDQWKPLNERWNKIGYTISGHGRPIKLPIKGVDLIMGPRIMHFASVTKPWLSGNADPLRFIYFKYISQTPWKVLMPSQNGFYYSFIRGLSYVFPVGIFILLMQIKRICDNFIRQSARD